MGDNVSDKLDEIDEALTKYINGLYDEYSTNLIRTDGSPQPDYGERGKGKQQSGRSQPRDVRWWKR